MRSFFTNESFYIVLWCTTRPLLSTIYLSFYVSFGIRTFRVWAIRDRENHLRDGDFLDRTLSDSRNILFKSFSEMFVTLGLVDNNILHFVPCIKIIISINLTN